MVLRAELEGDGIADLCSDIRGVEGERASATDDYMVV